MAGRKVVVVLVALLASGWCNWASLRAESLPTAYGVFVGGRRLPTSGFLLDGRQYCSGSFSPSPRPLVVMATSTLCSLETKIKNAKNSNASSLLLVVDREFRISDADNERKHFSDPDISIIFMSHLQSNIILKTIRNNEPASIFVTIEELDRFSDSHQPKQHLLMSAAVVSIIVVIGGCYGLWYCRDENEDMKRRNVRKLQMFKENSIEATMDKIPTRTLLDTKEKVIEEYHTCAVCFENYKLSEMISALPCSHIFHKQCVYPWLAERKSCPLCKMDILKHYGLPAASSEESILNIPLDDVVSYLEGVTI